MSTGLASSLGLGLYALLILPIIAAAFGSNVRPALVIFGALLLAIAVFNTGIFQRSSLTPTDVVVRAATSPYDAQCKQILELAEEYGLQIDRSNPEDPTVVGNGVEQLPTEVRNALIDCAETLAPATTSPGPSTTEETFGPQ